MDVHFVMPAQAGIHACNEDEKPSWIAAFDAMTEPGTTSLRDVAMILRGHDGNVAPRRSISATLHWPPCQTHNNK